MAHVAELPGCFTVGTDAARAVGAVPRAIVDFLAWLRSCREPLVPEAYVPRPSMADLFVEEVRRDGAPTVAGSKAGVFDFDTAAWDDEKFERTLRWLGYSRASLMARIEGRSDDELRARMLGPGRSAWDTLRHVANAEFGYINRIAGPPAGHERVTESEPADVRERLVVVREAFLRQARAVPAENRGEVVYAEWAHRPEEPWTLTKAVRRALEHEREHTAEL
jgi:uncharacterized damage-inducible protein DinB